MSADIAAKACRLIKAATGEEYGDGYTVTDVIHGYAEPGYGSSDSVIVLGNWNNTQPYADRQAGLEPTKAQSMPERLAAALERVGAEIQWLDEWTNCLECYKALRTQPDSYVWKPAGAWTEYGFTCAACMLTDVETYLEDYVNEPTRCVTWADGAALEQVGYVQWKPEQPQSYETGWHAGQDANPEDVYAEITEAYPDASVVFLLDANSQFYSVWSAYFKTEAETEG